MTGERSSGTSVLYVCPLKAPLNNLLPRLETYASWRGRTAALWHGDTTAGTRRILAGRPDVLLTTPESLEAMLVSVNVDHPSFFSGLQAAVVDEVHAFASDDRGWHLLAVLERLQRDAGRPVQRVGLSATVGYSDALLIWLQGSGAGKRPGQVIPPGGRLHPRRAVPGHELASMPAEFSCIAALTLGDDAARRATMLRGSVINSRSSLREEGPLVFAISVVRA